MAAALFAERGYDAATMDEIAQAADVSRATVFNFYPRKADLVLAWFGDRRAEVAGRLTEVDSLPTDTATELAVTLQAIARVFEQDPSTGRAMVRAWLQAGGPLLTPESETSGIFAGTIHAGRLRGEIAPGVDPERAGHVLFDAYLGVLYRWVDRSDVRVSLEDELLAVLGIVLTGIVTDSTGLRPSVA